MNEKLTKSEKLKRMWDDSWAEFDLMSEEQRVVLSLVFFASPLEEQSPRHRAELQRRGYGSLRPQQVN